MAAKPLRIGIVGYGKMGRIREDTINAHPDAEVVALADPFVDPSSVKLPLDAKWQDMLERDMDALVVSCTNDLIPEVAIAAMRKGLHVFCEKPPGRNVQDIEAIRNTHLANPALKLKFGFNHRYHKAVSDALNLVRSGTLGDVLWMRGVYGKAGGAGFAENWRNDPSRSGGGILLDQGIHMLDLFHNFCGEFPEVQSFVSNQYWQVPVEDNAFAILRNDRQQVAMIHSSATQWKHTFRLEIYLEKGFLKLEGILSSTMTYGKESLTIARCRFDEDGSPIPNPEETVSYYGNDSSWELEMNEFVGAVVDDKPVQIGTADHALAAMRAVYSIYAADPAWGAASSKNGTDGQ